MVDPSTREVVATEWARRVAAEYRSAALAQHLGLWLIQLGAPIELIERCAAVVADELVHAELSHAVCRAVGRSEPQVLDRSTLSLPSSEEPLELAALSACTATLCFGETVAVPLFRLLRAGCTEPVPRTALDRIRRDEGRHAAFGWLLLDWLLERTGDDGLTWLGARIDRLSDGVVTAYGRGGGPAVGEEARRWGLAPGHEYGEVLRTCWASELIPRFAARGLALPPLATGPATAGPAGATIAGTAGATEGGP